MKIRHAANNTSFRPPLSSGYGEAVLPEPLRVVFCDLCGKSFVTEIRMLEHKAYMHPITMTDCKKCPKCGKIFETPLAFKKHSQALHLELVCTDCPKKLGSRKTLKDHKKRMHSNNETE